ncbi:MAG TPA: hypothetical protein VK624_12015 [Steroidobacteraceae bacterium]|nr:hypothetical protein [Steroidobacteraceae bacterium]
MAPGKSGVAPRAAAVKPADVDAAPAATTGSRASAPEPVAADNLGASGHIDVGPPAFHQAVDRPSLPGFPNEFGDAHRKLEGESRDDSWSYGLEAEIQNSLTADVSSGNIKVEFLECRSTVCELRLSAADAKADALNAWSANSGSFPWSQRLQSVGMSMAMSDGRTHGLWIFRRPPK